MTPDVLASVLKAMIFAFFLLICFMLTVGMIKEETRRNREHERLLGLILDTKRMSEKIAELNKTVNLLVSESVFRSNKLNPISDQIKEKIKEERTTDEQEDSCRV